MNKRIGIAFIAVAVGVVGAGVYFLQGRQEQEPCNVPDCHGLPLLDPSAGPFNAPVHGFLVPTERSIPDGFKEDSASYFKQNYRVVYTAPGVGTATKLRFEELDYGPRFDFERKEAENARNGAFTRTDFEYQKSPGTVYKYVYGDSESLYLVWQDGRKTLLIRLSFVPHGKYTPQTLIDMLGTMVRS